MTKKTLIGLSLALLGSVLLVTSVQAAPQGPRFGAGPRVEGMGPGAGPDFLDQRFLRFLTMHLELSDEQKAEIKRIVQSELEALKTQGVFEQMRENREALKKATEGGAFNEAEVTALANKQGQLMAQLIVSRERVKAAVYKVLTP